jgi:hypothetical protein
MMEGKRSETVTLEYPVQLADKLLTEITIRRPTMKDLRLNPVKGADDLPGEMKLIGVVCGLRLEEVDSIDAADYGRLTETFNRFRTSSK